MYDFEPCNLAVQKTWGGFGGYSAGTATLLRATVEYNVLNNSGPTYPPTCGVPGQGTITTLLAIGTMSSTGVISAVPVAVPSSSAGPYPRGFVA